MPSRKAFPLMACVTALCLAALCFGACSFHPATPREFARYPRGIVFKGPFRAVSPEGVLFSVRTEDNDPKADLAFWRQAMKTRMGQAGYRIVADTSCAMAGGDAALLKLAAPVGNQDYIYWIAIAVGKKEILIAEAAGEAKLFLARSADLEKAIAATAW